MSITSYGSGWPSDPASPARHGRNRRSRTHRGAYGPRWPSRPRGSSQAWVLISISAIGSAFSSLSRSERLEWISVMALRSGAPTVQHRRPNSSVEIFTLDVTG
jgi:hypothetical protein